MSHNRQTTSFANQVKAVPNGETLELCYSCGTCTSKCMIQQKLEPRYNPRRLLRMIIQGMEDQAFKDPTTWMCSQCDLCYPACPQKIHISRLIQAVKQLAIEAGYTSPLEIVRVDEALCSGCGICVMACPYEALSLYETGIDGDSDRFSKVDKNLCMGCGICVAACPTGAIARKGVSNVDVADQIQLQPKHNDPNLAVFICDWCLRAAGDLSLLESYPENVRVIHLPCSGRIDPQMALMALGRGYDGVLVCGCKSGECHYMRGTEVGKCKMELFGRMYTEVVPVRQLVKFVQIGTWERGRIRYEIDGMLDTLLLQRVR